MCNSLCHIRIVETKGSPMHYRNHRIAPKGFVWIALAIGAAIVFSAQPAKPSAPIATTPPITLAMLADIVKPVCTPQTRTITKFTKATRAVHHKKHHGRRSHKGSSRNIHLTITVN